VSLRDFTTSRHLHAAAQRLFDQAWPKGKPVRLIGIGVSSLGPPMQQLGLWETPSEKGQRLQDALDAVRERFGRGGDQAGK
jgi:DNA polymerase IV